MKNKSIVLQYQNWLQLNIIKIKKGFKNIDGVITDILESKEFANYEQKHKP